MFKRLSEPDRPNRGQFDQEVQRQASFPAGLT